MILRYNRGMGMFTKRKQRPQWRAWFACLAILLNALLPSLSHAFAAQHAGAAIEICSSSGAVYTQAGLAPSSGQDAPQHIEHCLYCMHHAGSLALPPSPAPLVAVLKGHDPYPPLFYQAALPQFAWAGARPRGPPAAG